MKPYKWEATRTKGRRSVRTEECNDELVSGFAGLPVRSEQSPRDHKKALKAPF
jgi:hypothetical protein